MDELTKGINMAREEINMSDQKDEEITARSDSTTDWTGGQLEEFGILEAKWREGTKKEGEIRWVRC